jgi:hypothetical protein
VQVALPYLKKTFEIGRERFKIGKKIFEIDREVESVPQLEVFCLSWCSSVRSQCFT